MVVELFIAESGKYLVCRVTGQITAEDARQMVEQIEKFAHETGAKSRLIDVRNATNVSSISGNYDLAYKDLDELQVGRVFKAAVLVSPDDHSHDFAMIAIQNAGFNCRKFTDEAAAITWLVED